MNANDKFIVALAATVLLIVTVVVIIPVALMS